MTEQMPIAQPPNDYNLERPGTVGKPMPALVIVDAELRIQDLPNCGEPSIPGEICISGPTVMKEYKNDNMANSENFFLLEGKYYFRTGDLGYLDKHGFLYLSGRSKELIKVGGEQVNPVEVEHVLHQHPGVHSTVVFGIPDELRGEITAAYIVVKPGFQRNDEVTRELRQLCRTQGLPAYKIPRMRVVEEIDIPILPTKKPSRQLASKLWMSQPDTVQSSIDKDMKDTGVLNDATIGIRFILSLVVCFNHIGDHAWPHESEHSAWSSAVTSARTVGDVGVVCFGILAGFSLTVSMSQPVRKGNYLKFYESRLVPIHLIYLIACALCIVNRSFFCQPSNYGPYMWGSIDACRATALRLPYWSTWIVSVLVIAFTLQAWPIGLFVWHISYYTWFSSAYQFCIFCYPFIHKILADKVRQGTRVLICTHFTLQFLHFLTLVLMEAVYLSYRDTNEEFVNYWVFGGYMFPPFWCLRFACGCFLGFHFLQFRPDQKTSARYWGIVTDLMTAVMFITYVILIYFQVEVEHRLSDKTLLESRMYCGVIPRLAVPMISIYLYGLAVGRGCTARLCRNRILVEYLAPASYAMYLLHQPVFEWYSVITVGTWWSQRKRFEWFSPDPLRINWYETILVIILTVIFSMIVTHLINFYLMGKWLAFVRWATCRRRRHDNTDSVASVCAAIEDLAGVNVSAADKLQDTGLASLGVSALVSVLNNAWPQLNLKPAALLNCTTVQDIANIIDGTLQVHEKDCEKGDVC